jgi:hypothetical protein
MKSMKRLPIIAGIAAVMVLAVLLWVGRESIASWDRQLTVKKLLDPKRRQDALEKIVSWKRYQGESGYVVHKAYPIEDVIISIQPDGLPIYVVLFKDSMIGQLDPDDYIPVEAIDFDGTIVPWYQRFNLIKRSNLKDLNADGTLDDIDQIECEVGGEPPKHTVVHLWVLPINREMRPSLGILMNRDHPREPWSWKLNESGTPGVYDLVIGVKDEAAGKITPRAVYTWSATDKRFIGPEGGLQEQFLRIDESGGIEETGTQIDRFAWGSDSSGPQGR